MFLSVVGGGGTPPLHCGIDSLPLEGKGDRLRWMRWKIITIATQSTPHQSLRDSLPSRGGLLLHSAFKFIRRFVLLFPLLPRFSLKAPSSHPSADMYPPSDILCQDLYICPRPFCDRGEGVFLQRL